MNIFLPPRVCTSITHIIDYDTVKMNLEKNIRVPTTIGGILNLGHNLKTNRIKFAGMKFETFCSSYQRLNI